MFRSLFAPVSAVALCLTLAACASHASPEDAQMSATLAAQGKALLASGKATEARDIYQSATVRDEENSRAWNGLGAAYDLLGKKDKAEEAFLRAVELAPKDPAANNNLAHLYLEKGDPEAALNQLKPWADAEAPAPLKQNLSTAQKALQAASADVFADLGSFPTAGLAEGRIMQARKVFGKEADALSFSLVPEVKVSGGTPVFTVRLTGGAPKDLCAELMDAALPCVAHGK